MKKVLLTAAALGLMAGSAWALAPSQLGAGIGGPLTQQYHSYDGLICTDCHTLHGSENGAAVSAGTRTNEANGNSSTWAGFDDLTVGGGYRELLKKGDWTDMCLSCHKEGNNKASTADLPSVESVKYGDWTAPIVMTQDGYYKADGTINGKTYSMPAGDFYYSNMDPKKGHNPAYTKGFSFAGEGSSKLMRADTLANGGMDLKASPPGGAITDGEWSCHSCHGMHSRFSGGYTAYRQIKRNVNGVKFSTDVTGYGVETKAGDYTTGQQAAGYEPLKSNSRGDLRKDTNGNWTVYVNKRKGTSDTALDGADLDGADLLALEGDTNKNVYRGGFSSFCSTCHGNFHDGSSANGAATVEGGNNGKTEVNSTWVKHPTNISMDQSVSTRKYGINTYKKAVKGQQSAVSPNPSGYDWKYPLVQTETTGIVGATLDVKSTVAGGTLHNDDRIMCLTCHKAHASQYENMVRWDPNGHAFIKAGEVDFTGSTTTVDNIAYGCGKCHQKGGADAYIKTGF